jgi:1-acyl-sn-glycerol-3-phosphate acyltransferase
MSSSSVLIPGQHSARFVKFFTWYVRRLFAKRFAAVRLAKGSREVLRSLDAHDGPAIIALTHSSWWDPLLALMLGELCASRSGCAPMDAAMLRKFGFFRRLGIFGVEPSDPRSLPAMAAYVLERFRAERKGTLWITPQGTFADPRDPVVLRPGAASIAARAQREGLSLRVLVVAIEYGFWLDQKPEVFVRCATVATPASPSTPEWHRLLQSGMQTQAHELATLVRAREPEAFDNLLASSAGINPAMNLWHRLRGQNTQLVDRARSSQ